MPRIAHPKSDDRKVLVERMPSGTSRSSNTLRRTALDSIREVQVGVGTGSELLYQAAIRTLGGFYFGSPGASFSVRNIKEVAREEILSTLAEIYDLLTWPEGWNGYDACAPKYDAVQYADHWIELFYLEVIDLRMDWLEPNVTASAEGEVVFEWRHGINRLTIYIGNQYAEYVKDWGLDINTEMEDGYANSPSIRRALWKWLMS
jgi:hypothetical protein